MGALVCGLAWVVSSPIQGSPDEEYHLTSIWCADGPSATCRPAARSSDGDRRVEVPGLLGTTPPCFAFKPGQSAACQDSYQSTVITSRVNNGDYPPGFYRVMHLFVGSSIVVSVLLMRSFNLVLALALMVALYLAASHGGRRLMIYVLAPTAVPFGWYLVASANPSSWAVTGVTACGFGMHGFLGSNGKGRVVNASAVAVGTTMAVSSRGDAAVFVVVVALALSVLHLRTLRATFARFALPLAVVTAGMVAFTRSPQVASVAASSPVAERSGPVEGLRLLINFPTLVTGLFGEPLGLGWTDVRMPVLTTFGSLGVLILLLVRGIRPWGWHQALATSLLAVAMFVLPLWSLYRQRLDVINLQPRYVYPILPIITLVALSGSRRREVMRLTPAMAWIVYVVLVAAQAAAVTTNTRRYVSGLGATSSGEVWWWQHLPAPYLVCAVGSAGFAVFAILLVRLSSAADHTDAG